MFSSARRIARVETIGTRHLFVRLRRIVERV